MARRTITNEEQLYELLDTLKEKTRGASKREYLQMVENDIVANVHRAKGFTKRTGANYLEYLAQYAERAAMLKNKYNSEMVLDVASQATFEAKYLALVNTRRRQGKRPGNVTRDIISDEAYEYTAAQAKAFSSYQKKQVELWGEAAEFGVTQQKARLGKMPKEFWEALKEDRQRLKKIYYDEVSQEPQFAGASDKKIWAEANRRVTETIGEDWFYVKDK